MKKFFLLTIVFFLVQAQAQTWNDVSRLNPENVAKLVRIHSEKDVIDVLNNLSVGDKVTISGTRHSQGGHIVYPNGIVLDMTGFNKVVSISPKEKRMLVQSGATWETVQKQANQHGLAVTVMQSSNIFSVGGSLSANAHGRDPRFGPVIETVRSIKVALANGEIVKASRTINPDLFKAAIGGYGLLGIILEAEIELTDNLPLKKVTKKTSVSEYASSLHNQADELSLHYGRCSFVHGESFLSECYAINFSPNGMHRMVSVLTPEENIKRNALVFDVSRKSSLGKAIRWWLQKHLMDKSGKQIAIDRNPAMQPEVLFLEYDSPKDTDILQEYFVPIESFPVFLNQLKQTLEKYDVNLLSVTLRYLKENHESYLTYATDDMIAVVLYINIELTDQSIQVAKKWTRELVNLSLNNKGTYYLTYQGFPTLEQFELAYPKWMKFMDVKCKYDPNEVFYNRFYEQYLKAAYKQLNQSDKLSCAGL